MTMPKLLKLTFVETADVDVYNQMMKHVTGEDRAVPCARQVVVWYKEHAASLQDQLLYQACTATWAESKEPEIHVYYNNSYYLKLPDSCFLKK